MIVKASGRSALIFAAGLLVLLTSPVMAATDGDDSASDSKSDNQTAAPATLRNTVRHASHRRRSYAHHRLHTIEKADADTKKAAATDAAPADNKVSPNMPPSIANANAQMLLAGTQINAAAVIPAGTDARATASDSANADNETLIAAADQLNDVDRTLQEGSSTSAAPAGSPPEPAATMAGESTSWDQTSLIGKIFIGFGALLTMASAARMFIT